LEADDRRARSISVPKISTGCRPSRAFACYSSRIVYADRTAGLSSKWNLRGHASCRFTVLGDHTQIAVSANRPAPARWPSSNVRRLRLASMTGHDWRPSTSQCAASDCKCCQRKTRGITSDQSPRRVLHQAPRYDPTTKSTIVSPMRRARLRPMFRLRPEAWGTAQDPIQGMSGHKRRDHDHQTQRRATNSPTSILQAE